MTESKKKKRLNSTKAPKLFQPNETETKKMYGIGAQMLYRWGYVAGKGLGKNLQGISQPLQVKCVSRHKAAIGSKSEKKFQKKSVNSNHQFPAPITCFAFRRNQLSKKLMTKNKNLVRKIDFQKSEELFQLGKENKCDPIKLVNKADMTETDAFSINNNNKDAGDLELPDTIWQNIPLQIQASYFKLKRKILQKMKDDNINIVPKSRLSDFKFTFHTWSFMPIAMKLEYLTLKMEILQIALTENAQVDDSVIPDSVPSKDAVTPQNVVTSKKTIVPTSPIVEQDGKAKAEVNSSVVAEVSVVHSSAIAKHSKKIVTKQLIPRKTTIILNSAVSLKPKRAYSNRYLFTPRPRQSIYHNKVTLSHNYYFRSIYGIGIRNTYVFNYNNCCHHIY